MLKALALFTGLLASPAIANYVQNPTFTSTSNWSLGEWSSTTYNGESCASTGYIDEDAQDGDFSTEDSNEDDMSQTLSGTKAGLTYTWSFDAALNGGNSAGQDYALRFLVNGEDFTPGTPDGGNSFVLTTNFQTFSGTFVSQGDDIIEFAAFNNPAFNFVTNVDVEPSSSPSLAARRAHKRRVNRDQPLCPSGLTACPLPGAVLTDPQNSASLQSAGYECLDIATDMNSCGGCASTGQGLDCEAFPHARQTWCNLGQCAICSYLQLIGQPVSHYEQSSGRTQGTSNSLSSLPVYGQFRTFWYGVTDNLSPGIMRFVFMPTVLAPPREIALMKRFDTDSEAHSQCSSPPGRNPLTSL
ncbi:MAG: hypothetical protein TREMPRED_003206 [Tremellales sp. Tagirdzhanova-0007]|nr:MAG: hypothetical protein TREMPRED_003206 [Tremellales sp. Tagirdzhanova-0007]